MFVLQSVSYSLLFFEIRYSSVSWINRSKVTVLVCDNDHCFVGLYMSFYVFCIKIVRAERSVFGGT